VGAVAQPAATSYQEDTVTQDTTAITAAELADLLGTPDAPLLLDVRRRAVFEADGQRIAGARWRDHRRAAAWGPVLPAGRPVVVYCVHGHNVSQGAVAVLRALGLPARHLEGGLEAFRAAGGTLVAKGGGLPPAEERPTRWVTRARPKIDRIACPWFIRRFVDPEAQILFVGAEWVQETAAEFDAIPFDVPDTAFSHDGELCSFDTFLARFGVTDPALLAVARVVRGADTGRPELAPEAAGLLALSLGLSAAIADDQRLLDLGMTLYDALYAWARRARAERHDWRPETLPRGAAA
jgi:rhodanese-related sulfurtransferase